MSYLGWAQALDRLKPYVYKILTPLSSGTGFQVFQNEYMVGIATAFHVIDHAFEWDETVKLIHYQSGEEIILHSMNRGTDWDIDIHPDVDLAFITFAKSEFDCPTEQLKLMKPSLLVRQGIEMGWCGFPGEISDELCFFSGRVSACYSEDQLYLVDGKAFPGVSGGPAFILDEHDKLMLCGIITSVMRVGKNEDSAPLMCHVVSIERYHDTITELTDISDHVRKKEAESNKQISKTERSRKKSKGRPQVKE